MKYKYEQVCETKDAVAIKRNAPAGTGANQAASQQKHTAIVPLAALLCTTLLLALASFAGVAA